MNAQLLELTAHAARRMSQRGIASGDLELVRWIGTEVEGGLFVREKDVQELERILNQLRDQARRLIGKRVVVNGDVVVTAYHADRRKTRRLLRGAEARSFRE